jgi:hypothetical protein
MHINFPAKHIIDTSRQVFKKGLIFIDLYSEIQIFSFKFGRSTAFIICFLLGLVFDKGLIFFNFWRVVGGEEGGF